MLRSRFLEEKAVDLDASVFGAQLHTIKEPNCCSPGRQAGRELVS